MLQASKHIECRGLTPQTVTRVPEELFRQATSYEPQAALPDYGPWTVDFGLQHSASL